MQLRVLFANEYLVFAILCSLVSRVIMESRLADNSGVEGDAGLFGVDIRRLQMCSNHHNTI